jgi:hypothetical protein
MAAVDWYVEGLEFGNCNCSYSCPCQFEERPTHGHCQGFEALNITRGHFGDTDLTGLKYGLLYAWPGAIFEGGGEMQMIIDARATPAQRKALETVLTGGETEEAKTHWWVYHAMCEKVHPTLYRAIEFDADMEARTGRVVIPGVVACEGRPIQAPHGGGEHRVRIDIPNGIEFELAEIGSASCRTSGEAAITLELSDCYGQWNILRHSGTGVVHR